MWRRYFPGGWNRYLPPPNIIIIFCFSALGGGYPVPPTHYYYFFLEGLWGVPGFGSDPPSYCLLRAPLRDAGLQVHLVRLPIPTTHLYRLSFL